MIGINPSPSSQCVPAHLHKIHGEMVRSQETGGFKVWFWMDQDASPYSRLEADPSYCTNCLEHCLCECNCSLEIPYRLDSSKSIRGFTALQSMKTFYLQVLPSHSLNSTTGWDSKSQRGTYITTNIWQPTQNRKHAFLRTHMWTHYFLIHSPEPTFMYNLKCKQFISLPPSGTALVNWAHLFMASR